jgi:hypothetical protein
LKLPHLELDCSGTVPRMTLDGRVVSLRLLEVLTAENIAVLEKLSDPGMDGQVVRIEQRPGGVLRIVKIGIAGHVLHKAVRR